MKKIMPNENNTLVSVIIATRNESANIERIIKNLKCQTYSNIEIIVVDNGSSDNTQKLAIKLLSKENVFHLPHYVDLTNVKNFRGAQVNFGVQKSKGELIFFPDADMTFDNNLVEEAVGKMELFDSLYVPEIVIGNGLFGKIRNFERSFYNSTCIDAVRFVTRHYFEKVNGFDEKNIAFAPDDWDLTKMLKKSGASMNITQSVKYHHEESLSLSSYLRKKIGYVNTFNAYIEKWGSDDEDVTKQFSLKYRYFTVFIENGKWRKLISRIDLAIGVYVLRILVGVKYLFNR
jgi:glycosyltransferase involved in cell wall biosynthesis